MRQTTNEEIFTPEELRELEAGLCRSLAVCCEQLNICPTKLASMLNIRRTAATKILTGQGELQFESVAYRTGVHIVNIRKALKAVMGPLSEDQQRWLYRKSSTLKVTPIDAMDCPNGVAKMAHYLQDMKERMN